MPRGDGQQSQPDQRRAAGDHASEKVIEHRQGQAGAEQLGQAQGCFRAAQQRQEGDSQVALQDVHPTAPGHKVAGPGIAPGVHPVGEQGPGLIARESLVLVEPGWGRAKGSHPHQDPNGDQAQGHTHPYPAFGRQSTPCVQLTHFQRLAFLAAAQPGRPGWCGPPLRTPPGGSAATALQ